MHNGLIQYIKDNKNALNPKDSAYYELTQLGQKLFELINSRENNNS